ncbi:transcriptional regulator [Streptomyces sp. NPDC005962]|uniref:transcriptional regulator n=1 Tax=Streptomyces sp. NPDC005962 TaxID=3154466 RepID=UPI0033CEC33C
MASTSSVSELRRATFARRLPAALSELVGPAHGAVSLPLHLAWSGLTRFDLDQPRLRMSFYRIVLAEGMRDDLVHYLNQDLLIWLWPVLRTLISRDIRDTWEGVFTELTENPDIAERLHGLDVDDES